MSGLKSSIHRRKTYTFIACSNEKEKRGRITYTSSIGKIERITAMNKDISPCQQRYLKNSGWTLGRAEKEHSPSLKKTALLRLWKETDLATKRTFTSFR